MWQGTGCEGAGKPAQTGAQQVRCARWSRCRLRPTAALPSPASHGGNPRKESLMPAAAVHASCAGHPVGAARVRRATPAGARHAPQQLCTGVGAAANIDVPAPGQQPVPLPAFAPALPPHAPHLLVTRLQQTCGGGRAAHAGKQPPQICRRRHMSPLAPCRHQAQGQKGWQSQQRACSIQPKEDTLAAARANGV